MSPSDARATIPCAREPLGSLRTDPTSELRPQCAPTSSSIPSEALMAGRPREAESKRRAAEFLRLVADGHPAPVAIKAARIKPERAAAILLEIARPLLAKAA